MTIPNDPKAPVPPHPPDERWPVSWQASRDALLDDSLAATPAQRLQWLEEVLLMAYRAGALPRRDD